MRAAPPVEIQTALRGGWWLAAAGLWCSALAVTLAWFGWHLSLDAGSVLVSNLPLTLVISLLSVGTLSAAATLLWHARQVPMRLSWTGSHWLCVPAADPVVPAFGDVIVGEVDLMLDLGQAMLLRWRAVSPSGRRVTWLPVSRRMQRANWHALRVALCQPTPVAPPQPEQAL